MTQYNGVLIVWRAAGPPPTGMTQIQCQRCGWFCNIRKVDKKLIDEAALSGVLCAECYAKVTEEEYGM